MVSVALLVFRLSSTPPLIPWSQVTLDLTPPVSQQVVYPSTPRSSQLRLNVCPSVLILVTWERGVKTERFLTEDKRLSYIFGLPLLRDYHVRHRCPLEPRLSPLPIYYLSPSVSPVLPLLKWYTPLKSWELQKDLYVSLDFGTVGSEQVHKDDSLLRRFVFLLSKHQFI